MADGATESSYAGVWARLLVERFAAGEIELATAADFLSDVASLESLWRGAVLTPNLPWFAEEKILQGASAAFLGLTLAGEQGALAWRAVAVGDACLALVRDGELLQSFPWERAEDLGSRPVLLSSAPRNRTRLLEHVRLTGGPCAPGDELFLMTDGLARWFLESYAGGDKPWHILAGIASDSEEQFAPWVAELREAGVMRNDDVTLTALRIP
ncbi:MAG: protein phosphatase 2C domain-containing protein [Candidatus Wallbacteria bacterium]|nr:protein phosphatase 2C domain-containing protein [Candidatus Wallbacteria bacterium]